MFLMAFIIIAAIVNLGVETFMFAAALGATGLAVGIAFKDTFSNIGARLFDNIFRPLKQNIISKSHACKTRSKRSIYLALFCV